MSEDTERRLSEHNSGKVKSTKHGLPWEIIYEEEHPNRIETRKREKYLKSAAGRKFRKNMGM